MSTPGVRERKRVQRSQEIVQAAFWQINAKGLQNVTIDDIASSAGISRRTFFNYFSSIDDALAAPMRSFLSQAITHFQQQNKSLAIYPAVIAALEAVADNQPWDTICHIGTLELHNVEINSFLLNNLHQSQEQLLGLLQATYPGRFSESEAHMLTATVISCTHEAILSTAKSRVNTHKSGQEFLKNLRANFEAVKIGFDPQ